MASRRAWARPSASGHWEAEPRSIHESACTGLATEAHGSTADERGREAGKGSRSEIEKENEPEREGKGESESTVDRLVCLAFTGPVEASGPKRVFSVDLSA